ncbi:helix-turn-helix transcriptional regulator [Aliarcobacter butzleri]|uniref:helix-turn-helix transcriptional regulator n=1 Tax=Aliarcobacter butzleri TaxID=28197 RepID=UPI00125F6155|nr:DNA-binding protein [Aliarcobacter butzleri]MDK2047667.1 DNA-binding protein [Aliarcobacter butzleri]
MKEFNFELIFKLVGNQDSNEYLDKLFENGCDDATISTGQLGMLCLSFTREATNASEAVESAINDVKQAIPSAKLVEVTPDIVNISEISYILGHSRQYTRKLFNSETSSLPAPIHIGNPSIWHLSEVLNWLKMIGKQEDKINENLFELSHVTKEINIKRQLEAY